MSTASRDGRPGPAAGGPHEGPKEPGPGLAAARGLALGAAGALAVAVARAIPLDLGPVPAFWPLAGLSLAAACLWGPRATAATSGGALLGGLAPLPVGRPDLGDTPGLAVALALAAAAQGALGARMATGGRPGGDPLGCPAGVARLVLAGGTAGSLAAAVVTAAVLALAGATPAVAVTAGAAVGAASLAGGVVWGPLVLAFARPRYLFAAPGRIEALVLALLSAAIALVLWGPPLGGHVRGAPVAHLALIPMFWAAVRFGPRGVGAVLALVSLAATAGTAAGLGPQAGPDGWRAASLLDMFLVVTGSVGLLVAAAVESQARSAAEARRSSMFLHSIVENIPDMVFVKEAEDLRFVLWNRVGEQLLGIPRSQLIGRTDYDVFPEHEADFFTRKDREAIRRGGIVDIPEEPIHVASGAVRWLHTKKITLPDEAGRPAYLLGISEDVTERRAAEQQRLRVVDRLRELDEVRARFVANVTHELRTPLTLILGLTHRLRQEADLLPEVRRDLEAIERSAAVLHRLVDDLLDAARMDAGKLRAEHARIDLAALVRRTCSGFEVLASRDGVSFAVETPPVLSATVDPDRMERALSNLLSNAFKHVVRGGQVRCTLTTAVGRGVIEVADDGPGVPAEARERVFERFVQLGDDARAGGTGLGLAIVKEVAWLHDGSVSVGEAPEGGALFTFEVPLEPAAGVAARDEPSPSEPLDARLRPAEAPTDLPTPDEEDGRPIALVVEDHPDMNRFLVDTLRADLQVIPARDGVEALERAAARVPDVVVTDLMMPRMDGEALLRAMRERPALAEVPVLVLTARTDPETRVRLLREGARDFVQKPFSSEELRARVDGLVAAHRARALIRAELASQEEDLLRLSGALVERARELRVAWESAEAARQVAEAAAASRTRFLGLVSHELRTPLTTLLLNLQVLKRDVSCTPSARAQESISWMDRAVRQLRDLVETLLEYTRLESGQVPLRLCPTDPTGVAWDVVQELRPRAVSKGLELRLVAAPGASAPIQTDPRLLRLVISNLVDNAIKFTTAGSVTVGVSHRAGGAVIEVRDTGTGIPEDARDRVFRAFEQLEPLDHKHLPGVGLGLALVRQLVEALGGTIELESEVGRGSTFRLSLPPDVEARGQGRDEEDEPDALPFPAHPP
ncbi:ATP-binding protein [Myxococcota bacterium]|nr:ATP-binding protein [Myxococcota bacterium]